MAIVFPGGTLSAPTKILQVAYKDFPSTYTMCSVTYWANWAGSAKSITTLGANSKILYIFTAGRLHSNSDTAACRLKRGGSVIGVGNSDSNREGSSFTIAGSNANTNTDHTDGVTWMFVDEPSASAGTTLTYSLDWRNQQSGSTYLNRNLSNSNDGNPYSTRSRAQVIIIEIGS